MVVSTTNEQSVFRTPYPQLPLRLPAEHWELDRAGQPTGRNIQTRRKAEFITPIPKPRSQKGKSEQQTLALDDGTGLSTAEQQYDPTATVINELRTYVDRWRELRDPKDWLVTPETERLLKHWRTHPFSNFRPFFCQVEAAETAIWLTEVAPKFGKNGAKFIEYLKAANEKPIPNSFAWL